MGKGQSGQNIRNNRLSGGDPKTGREAGGQPVGTSNFGGGGAKGTFAMAENKKQAPPPPDYYGAAQATSDSSKQAVGQQTQDNRPNQNTPWASNQWTQDPNGNWTQSTSFNGQLGGTADELQNQMQASFGKPMDDGSAVRDQVTNAMYGQATSRLDPRFAQQGDQLRTQLINQGMDPGSAGSQNAMDQFGRDRNDAYSSAMNNAIGMGNEAQNMTFQQNMQARNAPLQELQGLQGFLSMPGFNAAGAYQPTNYLGASQMMGNYGLDASKRQSDMNSDMMGGISKFAAL